LSVPSPPARKKLLRPFLRDSVIFLENSFFDSGKSQGQSLGSESGGVPFFAKPIEEKIV